jgi:hypothetical protein
MVIVYILCCGNDYSADIVIVHIPKFPQQQERFFTTFRMTRLLAHNDKITCYIALLPEHPDFLYQKYLFTMLRNDYSADIVIVYIPKFPQQQ